MRFLPSEQEKLINEMITAFQETGRISLYEPCNCGSQIRHNNGGNYHEIVELARDSGNVYVKYDTTCVLSTSAEWELCDDWKEVIRKRGDYDYYTTQGE